MAYRRRDGDGAGGVFSAVLGDGSGPTDADELWVGDRAELEDKATGVLRAPVVNFVQHRSVLRRSTAALLTMRLRPLWD